MSLDMLRGFEAAARRLSFTLAANDLCITQSAVSRQIKTLEQQLDAQLFHRVNRRLELTEAGQRLFSAVKEASLLIDQAVATLDDRRARQELALTVAGPFASCWLVPRLAQFARLHPQCDVRIDATNDVTTLQRKRFDLAIWHFSPGAAPENAVRLVADEVFPVCAPTILQNPERPLNEPHDLAEQVLIQFVPIVDNRPLVDWFRWLKHMRLEKMMPRGTLSFSHYDQVLRAAIDGSGVALGRWPLVAYHLQEGLLQALFENTRVVTGAWHFIVAPEAVLRPHVIAFLVWLREEADRDEKFDSRSRPPEKLDSRSRPPEMKQ